MKKIFLILCLVLFIFAVSSVSATDVNQTIDENVLNTGEGTFQDLQEKIDNAQNASVVSLDKDYVYGGGGSINIDKDITIDGNGHTIDGNHAAGIFNIEYAEVVLKNIVFVNALGSDYGGAIYANTVNLEIDNCSFINNAAHEGGAIYAETAHLSVNNSRFLNNSASSGPAIYLLSYGFDDMMISNSVFNDNTAEISLWLAPLLDGGNVYVNGDAYLMIGSGLADHQITVLVPRESLFDTPYPNITFINVSYNDFKNQSGTIKEDDENYNIDDETIRFEVYKDNVLLINTTNVTKDGFATIDYGSLALNTYDLKVYYKNLTDSGTLLIKKDPNLTLSVDNIVYGEDLIINFSISPEIENYENAQGWLRIWHDGFDRFFDIPEYEEYVYFKDKTVTIKLLRLDSFIASLDFDGDDTFYSREVIQAFNVTYFNESAIQPFINVNGLEKNWGDDKRFSFNMTDENGTAIANRIIKISINGVDYTRTTDESGCASMAINLDPGYYPTYLSFEGDNAYMPTSAYTYVEVLQSTYPSFISAEALKKYFANSERLSFKLADENGKGIAGKEIQISINGVVYYRTTDESGSASMAINLSPDNYSADLLFEGDDQYSYAYSTVDIEILSTINCTDMQKYYAAPDRFTVSCIDAEGNKVNEGNVEFNINGVMYYRAINDGIAGLNINLGPGKYVITAKNPATGDMKSAEITVLPILVNNHDLVKYYRNDSQFTVDLDGVDTKANQTVTFNINGVFYNRTTNENGTAKLNINLEPGEYIITSIFNGCMVSNKITVLPILEAEDLTMSYMDGSKFNAKLLDGNGNPLANTNVTFNINGVFYNRTTDKHGVAHLNINLMAGQYIITSSYNGCNIANKITIV